MTPSNNGGISKPPDDPIVAEFMEMPDDEHLRDFVDMKVDIATRLYRMGKSAYAWMLKGKNLDDLGMNGAASWLLAIGADQLYAPLFAKTMRDKALTRKLSRLSWAEQRHIGDGGTVSLLLLTADGKTDTIEVSPVGISDADQLNQLVASDHIRTVSEQRQWIEAKRSKAAEPVPERIGHLALDPERDGVIFMCSRGTFVSADTIGHAFKALRKGK